MLILSIIFPLAITLFIETGIYMILKHRDLKLFLVVSFMNLVLNASMNIILFYFGDTQLRYWLILIISEVSTVLIESLIVFLFMKFKYIKVLLFAFIANLVSFLIGLLLEPVYEHRTLLIVLAIAFLLGYLATYTMVLVSFLKRNTKCDSE